MQATAFFQEHQIQIIDARRGGYPCALVHQEAKAKNKRQRVAKRWAWEDCQALAKALDVMLGHNSILFESGMTSFENGKMYGYRNPSQCHESLLALHRDRLSRMSDEELQSASAIAAGEIL